MDMNQSLVQQILQQYGLAGASAYPLHSYNNFVYSIESADKRRFSLRICGFPKMKLRSMTDEMLWLDFVAQRNPRLAPRPVANRQGELVTITPTPEGERLSCLFAWVEGTELRGPATPLEMRKIGQSAAALHNIAREFIFPDATSDFRNDYRYDQSLMLSHRGWIDKHRSAIGTENVALLERAVDYVVAEMNRIGTTRTNYGMIHADLSPGNVLVQNGEIAIIDFEQLGRGHYLYDLTVLRTEWLNESPDPALLWQNFVAGYREVAKLPFRQEEELHPFLVAIQLNFLDWFYNSMTPTVQAEKSHLAPITYESIRQQVG